MCKLRNVGWRSESFWLVSCKAPCGPCYSKGSYYKVTFDTCTCTALAHTVGKVNPSNINFFPEDQAAAPTMHLLNSVNSSCILHFWSHAFPLLFSKFCLAIFCLFIIFQKFFYFYTSFYIYRIYLHSTLYITAGICCSRVHVATRGQYRVRSSITLHIIFLKQGLPLNLYPMESTKLTGWGAPEIVLSARAS